MQYSDGSAGCLGFFVLGVLLCVLFGTLLGQRLMDVF